MSAQTVLTDPTGPVIAIVGPTASGKSALADRVAQLLDSSVVSIDAMQLYRRMDIGTAKTPVGERHAPILMVDVCDANDAYSARLFQRDARACVDRLLAAGRVPVLCGGTGLYLDAVIDEMDFPRGERTGEARRRYEAMVEAQGADALHRLLEERDPTSAALIHPHNARRVVRALELLDEGTSYADTHAGLKRHRPHYETTIYAVSMARERLYARIDARVERMFASGLVDEVRGLLSDGLLSLGSTAGQAIGYKEVAEALEGHMTLREAQELVAARTRRYAKRQISWLKRDGRAKTLDLDRMSVRDAAHRVVLDLRAQRAVKLDA